MNRFFFSKKVPVAAQLRGWCQITEYQYEILSEPILLQINHRQLHTDYSPKAAHIKMKRSFYT